jgi:hypothetical protein
MKANARRGRFVAVTVLAMGAVAVTAAVAPAAPAKASKSASLVIRHQVRGCHAWSLNGGPFRVTQKVHLARGGFLTLTNNDLMAQELVKTRGPAVKQQLLEPSGKSQVMMGDDMAAMGGHWALDHMGARVKVTFPKDGVYRFKVVDRGDYVEVKTIGDDNELALTVVVS